MSNEITTLALESLVKSINDRDVYTCVIDSNVLIGEIQYVQLLLTPKKPIEFIKLDFTIFKDERKQNESRNVDD